MLERFCDELPKIQNNGLKNCSLGSILIIGRIFRDIMMTAHISGLYVSEEACQKIALPASAEGAGKECEDI